MGLDVMADQAARDAHNALLSTMPTGASHEPCSLCELEADVTTATDGRTFTEDEHVAVLTAAVQRETAEVAAARDSALSECESLRSRIDVLEAEKASLVSEKTAVEKELADFRSEIEQARLIAERQQSRVDVVRSRAGHLPESFFTAERAARWAALDDDTFEAAVADLEGTRSSEVKETAAFSGGEPVKPPASVVGQFFGAIRGDGPEK